MRKEWNIGDIVKPSEYTQAAIFCNQEGDRHIETINGQYVVVANPTHEPTIEEQIEALEQQVTARNIRASILGDEFAIAKMRSIEEQIEELRRHLEEE